MACSVPKQPHSITSVLARPTCPINKPACSPPYCPTRGPGAPKNPSACQPAGPAGFANRASNWAAATTSTNCHNRAPTPPNVSAIDDYCSVAGAAAEAGSDTTAGLAKSANTPKYSILACAFNGSSCLACSSAAYSIKQKLLNNRSHFGLR